MTDSMNIDISEVADHLGDYIFVDIREPEEIAMDPCPEDLNPVLFPLSNYEEGNEYTFEENKNYVLFCAMGGRSSFLVDRLQTEGIENIVSLNGGIAALKRHFSNE